MSSRHKPPAGFTRRKRNHSLRVVRPNDARSAGDGDPVRQHVRRMLDKLTRKVRARGGSPE
jgi:hypothetical protein